MTQGGEIQVELFAGTHIGLKRKNNEDNFLVADLTRGISGLAATVKSHKLGALGSLLLVSDGMGGKLAGEVASRMAVDHLHQELVVKKLAGNAEQRLLTAIERANLAIWHAGQNGSQPGNKSAGQTGMGTTITAVIIEGDSAYIAEVGDSRAYVVRAGKIIQLTKDQSMVQRLLDEGLISPEQAAHHPNRNLILQALGTNRAVNVEMTKLSLNQNDILLLCTDGLTNKVPDDEIKDIILGSMTVESACRNLIGAANRHGGDDNVTVVVAKFTGAQLPVPVVNLDTTDSVSLKAVKDQLRRGVTGEIRLRADRTQEIMRRTQQISLTRSSHTITSEINTNGAINSPANSSASKANSANAFAPKFAALEGSASGRSWKIVVIVVLVLLIGLLLFKLR